MGFLVKAVKSVIKTVVGVVSKVIGGVFGFLVSGGKAKASKGVNNLSKQLEPEAFRKIIFGRVAAPLDTRYWEVWGSKGEKFDEVIAYCGHRINAVLEFYAEDKLAINAAGVVQAAFSGVLTRDYRLGVNGQTGMIVGGGTQWNTSATFDGCPHGKYAWVPDEKKLPNGIPSRYTQVIEGALVYDPRRDSTVPGGSGTHRINDRTTWAYATLDGNGQPIGRNNALQCLWYLLGWTVQTKDAAGVVTGEMLTLGRGVDPQDINLATFIAGANACEVAGYYTDLALTVEDDHVANENAITCDGLIGRLIDPGGLWSYYANVDDTASIAVELTDADVIAGVSVNWDEYKGMADQYNQVGGKFVNPSSPVLFQAYPYPLVRDAVYEANLGVKRRKTQDFRQVLDNTLAQRLARLLLNQGQYQGEFSAGFNYRALRAQAWSVVRYTSERFGWVKLFRVWRYDISTDGGVGMLLKEIHASIWSAGTVTAPTAPGTGLAYDPTVAISATGVNVAQYPMAGAGGTLADGFRIYWDAPPKTVRRTEIRYRLVGTTYWETAGPVEQDITSLIVGPGFSGALYEAAVRHISIHEVAGPWIAPPALAPAVTLGQFYLGTTGNVNYAAITAAGGTAIWANVTGTGRPQDNADVTAANIAAGFTGQQPIASDADAVARILAMRGDNYARNGDFSEGGTGYNKGSSTAYLDLRTLGLAWSSPWTIYFQASGVTANTYFQMNNGNYIPFLGKRATIGMFIQANNAVTTFTVSVFCKDEGGNALTTQTATITTVANTVPTPYDVTLVLPAGTASIMVEVKRTSGDITQNQYFVNLRINNPIDPATSQLVARGSVTPSVPDNSFSYTSTTTSVTVSWPNITIYRADGSSITISSGSQVINSLTASTTYKVYPYVADNGGSSGSMAFVTGGSGAPTACFAAAGNAQAAATMNGRGNIPLNGFQVATPASGSGGGGGGGSVCYHEANLMTTQRGQVPAGELVEGDMLPSPDGWQRIKILRRVRTYTWVAVACGQVQDVVVPGHIFYLANGETVRADELKLGDLLKSNEDHREVTGLTLRREWADKIMTELNAPHLYYGGELMLLSHNPKP